MKKGTENLSREELRARAEKREHTRAIVKSLIFPVVFCGLVAGAAFAIKNYQNPVEEEEIIPIHSYAGGEDAEPIVMENDDLVFTMDPATTQFEVEVKDTGKIWRSNPEGAEGDTKALAEERNKLQSTLLMSYSITSGLETSLDNFSYSIDNGIYEITQDGDQVRVDYSLGDVEKEYTIPPVITKERFDAFCDNMDKKGKNLVQQYYKKYDIKKLKKKDNKEELLQNYPILADEVIYILRDTTKENTRRQMQGIFADAGYTYEDFEADKALSNAERSSDKPSFNVSVIYRLDGDDLTVEIPFDSLEYKKDYPMYSITPLPYFGSGSTEDQGFMVVPEGGGAIINFNNGKTSQNSYYTNLYGWDMCLGRDAIVHNTRAYYGLFGISDLDNAFNCELEDGRAYASIEADISGKNNSYNYVHAKYEICSREKYDVGDIANSDIYQYLDQLPNESIKQRYHFVDSGSYADMAKDYGSYLDRIYPDAVTEESQGTTPVEIEIVGAIDKTHQILGVPVSRPLKLTSYQEAADIIQDLTDSGVTGMSVKLSGWCNGGIRQEMLSKVNLIGTLGSKSDFNKLLDTARANGVNVYLNGSTQYAEHSNLLDGFFSYRDAAKFISKERAELTEYSSVTYSKRTDKDPYYLLHTETGMKMADNLHKYAADHGVGASFDDLGMDLSSDFYKKKTYSRQAVLGLQENKLHEMAGEGTPIMVNMGNDYAALYANFIGNMDLRGSEYTILDECIPFFQMAIHGKTSYAGEPVNLCGDPDDMVLYSAEYGAGLQFTFMAEDAFATQKTLYPQYYGASYDAWKDRALEIYNRYNTELGSTFGQAMTGHTNYSMTLACTEYEDGTKVYVNYGFDDAEADGITVPARDYLVVK